MSITSQKFPSNISSEVQPSVKAFDEKFSQEKLIKSDYNMSPSNSTNVNDNVKTLSEKLNQKLQISENDSFLQNESQKNEDLGEIQKKESQLNPKSIEEELLSKEFRYKITENETPKHVIHTERDLLLSPQLLQNENYLEAVPKSPMSEEELDMKNKIDIKKIEKFTRTPSPKPPKKSTTWSAMKKLVEGKHVVEPKPKKSTPNRKLVTSPKKENEKDIYQTPMWE